MYSAALRAATKVPHQAGRIVPPVQTASLVAGTSQSSNPVATRAHSNSFVEGQTKSTKKSTGVVGKLPRSTGSTSRIAKRVQADIFVKDNAESLVQWLASRQLGAAPIYRGTLATTTHRPQGPGVRVKRKPPSKVETNPFKLLESVPMDKQKIIDKITFEVDKSAGLEEQSMQRSAKSSGSKDSDWQNFRKKWDKGWEDWKVFWKSLPLRERWLAAAAWVGYVISDMYLAHMWSQGLPA